jgi:hypothetical protein
VKQIDTVMDAKSKALMSSDLRDAVVNFATYDYTKLVAEDIARMSAELVSIFDPSGVTGIVAYVSLLFVELSSPILIILHAAILWSQSVHVCQMQQVYQLN